MCETLNSGDIPARVQVYYQQAEKENASDYYDKGEMETRNVNKV